MRGWWLVVEKNGWCAACLQGTSQVFLQQVVVVVVASTKTTPTDQRATTSEQPLVVRAWLVVLLQNDEKVMIVNDIARIYSACQYSI